jgi:hypothetical protein
VPILIANSEIFKPLHETFTMPDYAKSIFDGELLYDKENEKYEFYIFDVLFYKGRDLRGLSFYNPDDLSICTDIGEDKLKLTNKVMLKTFNYLYKTDEINEFNPAQYRKRIIRYTHKNANEVPYNLNYRYTNVLVFLSKIESVVFDNFNILNKTYYPLTLIQMLHGNGIIEINRELQLITKNTYYDIDGLIIQSMSGTYPVRQSIHKFPQWDDSYKWKFPRACTIDVRVIYTLDTYALESGQAVCKLCGRTDSEVYVEQKFKLIDSKLQTEEGKIIKSGAIVECYFDEIWRFLRLRSDKTKPNSAEVIKITFDLIKNPVAVDLLI